MSNLPSEDMDANEIRTFVIDELSRLHYLPFYVHFKTIKLAHPGRKPKELPEFESFAIEPEGDELRIRLKPGMEWRDVLLEASHAKIGPDELPLTPNARALLDWLQRPGNSSVKIKVNTLGKKAGFAGIGSYDRWQDYCREIDLKTNFRVEVQSERGTWGGAVIELNLSENVALDDHKDADAPNPPFKFDPTIVSKEACDAFAKILEDTVISFDDPEPGRDFVVYDLSTHCELERVFPATFEDQEVNTHDLMRFLEKVRLAPCLRVAASVPWRGDRWLIGCRAAEGLDWRTVRTKIAEWRSYKGGTLTYGLSQSAGKLLDWLLSLRSDQFTDHLSPSVFMAWEDEIGFKNEYNDDLRRMKLEAMADEINEITPYNIRVFSGKAAYHGFDCRLLFKHKPTGEDLLVRQIRNYLLDHNSGVAEADVRKWLAELVYNTAAET